RRVAAGSLPPRAGSSPHGSPPDPVGAESAHSLRRPSLFRPDPGQWPPGPRPARILGLPDRRPIEYAIAPLRAAPRWGPPGPFGRAGSLRGGPTVVRHGRTPGSP